MKNGGLLLVALIGIGFGVFAGMHWARAQHTLKGWKTARTGVTKAKATRTSARGTFLGTVKLLTLAIVLVVVYILATTTTMFKK